MDSHTLDELDRKLIHALKVDGRAPFRLLGEVLGVSDQTVARRYRRLRTAGLLRVAAAPPASGTGQEWFVRIRCAPDGATPVAEALARRSDTYWVQLTSGGAEIVCVTRPSSRASQDALLLQKLPRTPRIIDVLAHQMLRRFEPDPRHFGTRVGGLSAAMVDRLRVPVELDTTVELDEADRAMVGVLGRDGRAGYPELAAASGRSESTVRRRLDTLRRCGALSFDIDVPNGPLGQQISALLWLSVAPRSILATAETMTTHPEVNFVAATTGPSNVLATVSCTDAGALFDYLATRVGALTDVRQVESAPVVRVIKRHGQVA